MTFDDYRFTLQARGREILVLIRGSALLYLWGADQGRDEPDQIVSYPPNRSMIEHVVADKLMGGIEGNKVVIDGLDLEDELD